jgi:hypothetical protein
LLTRHITQVNEIRAVLVGQRAPLDLGPEGAIAGSGDSEDQIGRPTLIDGIDQAGEFRRFGGR